MAVVLATVNNSVTLTRCWLSLAATPATSTTFASFSRSDVRTTQGSVRMYANGRKRSVSRVGTATALGVTAVNLPPAQVALIDSWRGQVVLFRDIWGRRVFGVFYTVTVTDLLGSGQDVAFSLSEVDVVEAV